MTCHVLVAWAIFAFTVFLGLCGAHTSRPTLRSSMSLVMFLRRKVPVGGRDETAYHLWVISAKTLIFGV